MVFCRTPKGGGGGGVSEGRDESKRKSESSTC